MKISKRFQISGQLSLAVATALVSMPNLAHAHGEYQLRLTGPKTYHSVSSLPGMTRLKECGKMLDASHRLDAESPNPEIQKMIDALNSEIIGQGMAIETLAKTLEMVMQFLNDPEKPMGRFMFMGPTGVGKTELVRALVRYLGGNPDVHMIRFDGGELQMEHEISRIKGAPPGFKGFDQKPALHPDNVIGARLTFTLPNGKKIDLTIILWDEIEKMSEAAYRLLLGILDNGKLTLGDDTPSVLRKTLIFGTSNEGAKDVERYVRQRRAEIQARLAAGEKLSKMELDETGHDNPEVAKTIDKLYMDAMIRKYAPEFRNRWHAFIAFRHLRHKEFLTISDVMIAKVQKRIFERAEEKFLFQVTPAAREWLVSKGTDFMNGSRELLNVIEFQLVHRLSKLLSNSQVKTGDVVVVDIDRGQDKLTFDLLARGLSEDELKAQADVVYPGRKMKNVKFTTEDGDSLEDKARVIKGLLKDISASPLGLTTLWNDAKTQPKVETITLAGGKSDTLTYKYISVEDVIVRLQYSSLKVAEAQAKNPDGETPVEYVVPDSGIPEAERMEYSASGALHKTSLNRLENVRAEVRKLLSKPL